MAGYLLQAKSKSLQYVEPILWFLKRCWCIICRSQLRGIILSNKYVLNTLANSLCSLFLFRMDDLHPSAASNLNPGLKTLLEWNFHYSKTLVISTGANWNCNIARKLTYKFNLGLPSMLSILAFEKHRISVFSSGAGKNYFSTTLYSIIMRKWCWPK